MSDPRAEALIMSNKNIKSIGITNDKHFNSETDHYKHIMTREAAINGYNGIEKIRAQPGQAFCVVAYFLSTEITEDGCHGMWYFIGTFSTSDQATESAKSLIEKTGIQTIYATETCSWQEINDKFSPNRTKMVPIDKRGKLRQQHEKEHQEFVEQYERESEIRKEIEEELTKESDPDSLEFYIQQWFRTIKSESIIDKLETDLKKARKQQAESGENLRKAYRRNPSHEDNWIPLLEERLPKRGERQLLEALKSGSDILRDEILHPNRSISNAHSTDGLIG